MATVTTQARNEDQLRRDSEREDEEDDDDDDEDDDDDDDEDEDDDDIVSEKKFHRNVAVIEKNFAKEQDLATKLAAVRKILRPAKNIVKKFAQQEKEEITICNDQLTFVPKVQVTTRISKAAIENSQTLTSGRRKRLLDECTKTIDVVKEIVKRPKPT